MYSLGQKHVEGLTLHFSASPFWLISNISNLFLLALYFEIK